MVLLKRVMWPRKGEELAIYENGVLLIDGHVIHADDRSITILGRNSRDCDRDQPETFNWH